MKILRLLLRHSRWRLLVAVASGALSGACAGALVSLTQAVLFGDAGVSHAALLFVILVIAHVGARMLSQSELLHVLQGMALPALRGSLARAIVGAPLRTTESVGNGRLSGVLMGDTLSIGLASMAWIFVAHSTVAILVAVAAVSRISVPITLMTLASIGVGVAIFAGLSSIARRFATVAQERQGRVYRHVGALVSGWKELALSSARRRAFFADALEPDLRASHEHAARAASQNDVSAAWSSMFIFVVAGVVLFGWSRTSPSVTEAVGGCVVAILYVQSELACVLEQAPLIVRGEVALRSIETLGLTLETSTETTETEPAKGAAWRSVELDAVTHVYRREDAEDEFTLGPINFSLKPGEVVFIIGGNGSGKSTLGKLLVGLYSPVSGAIRLDGEQVTAARIGHYRSHFSAIFSDYFLFDRLYGHHAPDEEATRWLADLRLSHIVSVKDGAFSTLDLSQGQKRRLALVSAYLEDRPIYLFDEWAADQDPAFKQVFYRQILPALKSRGKSVVVITHDDRYFSAADRVVRLHEGRLIESSGHAV